MITRFNLTFEPPEPPPHRLWPEYVRLTYGHQSGLPQALAGENDRAYPHGYLGWMIRMGYHLIGRIGERTTRTSDEAVVAAALLLDLQTERGLAEDAPGGVELLDELQGRLLAQLRRYSLPTGAADYQDDEALAVLGNWANCMDGVRGFSAFMVGEFLQALEQGMHARGKVTVRRWSRAAPNEQAEVAASLRALAAQVEAGEVRITEVRTVERRSTVEVRLRGEVRSEPVAGTLPVICPECV